MHTSVPEFTSVVMVCEVDDFDIVQGKDQSEGESTHAGRTGAGWLMRTGVLNCAFSRMLLKVGFGQWELLAIALVLILIFACSGAIVCTIKGSQNLAAVFTCVWTASIAVLAWRVSEQWHTMCENKIKAEFGKTLSEDYAVDSECAKKWASKFKPITLNEYRFYNFIPKAFGSETRLQLADKLHLRAVDHARTYSSKFFSKPAVQKEVGRKDMNGEYRVQNVRKMVNLIKKHSNTDLPARMRWIWFLGFVLAVGYCVNFVPVYSCVVFQEVVPGAAWTIIGGTVLFTTSLINIAAFDRDAAILAPPGSMFGVGTVLLFAAVSQSLFTVALSYTDLCLRIDEFWPSVLGFCISAAASMWVSTRMLAGKLVDYCELRIELLAIEQGDSFSNKDVPLKYIDSVFPLKPQVAKLSVDAATKLKQLSGDLWERWGIGLGVLLLGLVPSVLKIVAAMWEGKDGEDPSEVLPEEIFTMLGTMAVLIILLLSDRDLLRWLNNIDKAVWILLTLFTLLAQVFGAILGLQAAWRSDDPQTLVFVLVPAMLAITLQLNTCVWASIVLDLKLVKLMYRGHTYFSRTQLSKMRRKRQQLEDASNEQGKKVPQKSVRSQPEDGLYRHPLPKDDYVDDTDDEYDVREGVVWSAPAEGGGRCG